VCAIGRRIDVLPPRVSDVGDAGAPPFGEALHAVRERAVAALAAEVVERADEPLRHAEHAAVDAVVGL
jgi:hypothetical protein